MKLLDWLSRKKTNPYVDAGTALIARLVTSLNIPGWGAGLQPTYRRDEIEAIQFKLSDVQKIANQVAGGEAMIHRDAAEPMQRMFAAQALMELAGRECEWSAEAPPNWKEYAATYLKAWTAQLDPLALLRLGDLMAKAGHRSEAKETYQVVLLFPTHADAFYGGEVDHGLVSDIVKEAQDLLKELN